jgi:hypothetical protein
MSEMTKIIDENFPPEQLQIRYVAFAELRQALAPIEQEVRAAGYAVESISDLKRSGVRYKTAIPILLKWLFRTNLGNVKEIVADALAVPWAKPGVAPLLIEEFLRAPHVPYKVRIAEALRVIADRDVYDDMVAIFRDKRHGGYRRSLAEGIASTKMPGAVDVLLEMLDDEQLTIHVMSGLRKLKDPKSRPFLERFLTHENAGLREKAASAIKAIDKKIEREKQKKLDKKEK